MPARARRPGLTASWYDYHGVTAQDMAAVEATVPAVLTGTPMTREELATAVAERTGRPRLAQELRSGWGGVLKPMAALTGGRLAIEITPFGRLRRGVKAAADAEAARWAGYAATSVHLTWRP